MDADPAAAEGLPITDDDLKNFWKRKGKPSNSFPRIHRKHNVNLLHMANVYTGLRAEKLGVPASDAGLSWAKLQEELGYNEKQMQEVNSIIKDPKISFEDFVGECVGGDIIRRRTDTQGRKGKGEDLTQVHPGPAHPGEPPLVKKKRSKATKRAGNTTQQNAESAEKGRATEDEGRGDAAAQGHDHAPGSTGAGGGPSRTPQPPEPPARTPSAAPVPPAAHRAGPALSPYASSPLRRSPRTALFGEGQKDSASATEVHESAGAAAKATNQTPSCEGGAQPSNVHAAPAEMEGSRPSGGPNMPQERSDVGGQSRAVGDESSARPAPERRTSPRRTQRRTEGTPTSPPTRTEASTHTTNLSPAPEVRRSPRTTRTPSGTATGPSARPGSPLAQKPKKVAPKERPCPSNADPPCPGIVPSAANKCKTCGFDIKNHRLRAQEVKLEKKVSAVRDTKAIIRKVKDDLRLLSEKGFQVSCIWYDEPIESEESEMNGGKKRAAKSSEAHFLGFGELGSSWVNNEDVQKSYKRALKAYRKARKDQRDGGNGKHPKNQPSKGASAKEPPVTNAPGPNSYSLPESLRGIVESLKFDGVLKSQIVHCLERGEVDETSLKALIDDKDWLNPMFGDKAGPRMLFKLAVKKWAESKA